MRRVRIPVETTGMRQPPGERSVARVSSVPVSYVPLAMPAPWKQWRFVAAVYILVLMGVDAQPMPQQQQNRGGMSLRPHNFNKRRQMHPQSDKFDGFDIIAAFKKTEEKKNGKDAKQSNLHKKARQRKISSLLRLQMLCRRLLHLGIGWKCTKRRQPVRLTQNLVVLYEVAFGFLSNVVHLSLTPSDYSGHNPSIEVWLDCRASGARKGHVDRISSASQCKSKLMNGELVLKYPVSQESWKQSLQFSSEVWQIDGKTIRLFPYNASYLNRPMKYQDGYYILAEYLGGFVTLKDAFVRVLEAPGRGGRRQRGLLRLAALAAIGNKLLKEKNLYHNDAHFGNIMVWQPPNHSAAGWYANGVKLKHLRLVDLDSMTYGVPKQRNLEYTGFGQKFNIAYTADHGILTRELTRFLGNGLKRDASMTTVRKVHNALLAIERRYCVWKNKKCKMNLMNEREQQKVINAICRVLFGHVKVFDRKRTLPDCDSIVGSGSPSPSSSLDEDESYSSFDTYYQSGDTSSVSDDSNDEDDGNDDNSYDVYSEATDD